MSTSDKRLDAMRRNPAGDWTVADVERVCVAAGAEFIRSRAGSSHYKVKHPALAHLLTIPFARPIKPVYIRQLVNFLDAARSGAP